MIDRVARGAVFTPPDVGGRLVDAALEGMAAPRTACDLAAGDGRLLELVARRVEDVRLFAADIDGEAWRAGPGGVSDARFVVADALDLDPADAWPDAPPAGFDLIVGNPPFLDQLDAASALRPDARTRLRERFGDVLTSYTDVATLFLVRAGELLADGGRVALIMPTSFLGARDAAPARRRLLADLSLAGIWFGGPGIFPDAEVQVCALVLDRGGPRRRSVRRWVGPRWAAAPPVDVDADELAHAATWGPLVASLVDVDLPEVSLPGSTSLGQVAEVGAGFRDQFYGLAPLVAEIGGPVAGRGDGLAPLVTSGAIEPGRVEWGSRTTRIAGSAWSTPGIDPTAVPDGRLGRWVDGQRRPKLVVASQTPVIEAAADPTGEWVPSTPVVSVRPVRETLWRCLAILVAPPVAAWARAQAAGSALAPRSIRVSAPLLRAVPLPDADVAAWQDAADLLGRAHVVADGWCPPDAVVEAARRMTRAYGCGSEVDAWWRARAGRLSAP